VVEPVVPFDPASLGLSGDPYDRLAELRRAGPVVAVDGGFWAVTGHAAASEVLRHPACGSAPIGVRYLEALPPGAARDEMGHRINFLDPPDHPRVRGLVNKAFTPRRVTGLRPWMEATAQRLLEDVDGRGVDRPVDLLGDYAHQLPSLVISELLGVPPEDRDRLTGLSDQVAPLLGVTLGDDERATALAAAEEMHAFLGGLLDHRRDDPGDDLLSALATAEESGDRLSRAELLSLTATLYSAGHRTTRDLFTNGMSVLLDDPDRYQQVVDGAWPVGDVVDEMLRFETPTLFVARVSYEDVSVDGHDVPALTPIIVYLAAANRDPEAYDEPDAFRPGRTGPASLSFAFGAHYCLGASLARGEAEVMLEAVVQRWPHLRRADAGEPLAWHQRGPFRGLDRLLVTPG
jgi:hypothetical protein